MTDEQDRQPTKLSATPPPINGMIHLRSTWSASAILDRLEAAARSKGMKVFARLDQAHEAAEVGLALRPTQLLLFGNPRAGTLLMQASTSVALDLPLRALAWVDDGGQTWVTYDDPPYLGARHGLRPELLRGIEGLHALVRAAAAPENAAQ